MSQITTHILDTSQGRPASNILVRLEQQKTDGSWNELSAKKTDNDGRIMNLLPKENVLDPGVYQMVFVTAPYFEKQGIPSFYPEIEIRFSLREPEQHYHVPLLLSPFGYSTYRGS